MVAEADMRGDAAGVDLGLDGLACPSAAVAVPSVGTEALDASAAVAAVGRDADPKAVLEVPDRKSASVGEGPSATVKRRADDRVRSVAGVDPEDGRVAAVATGLDAGPVRLARSSLAGKWVLTTPVASTEVAGEAYGRAALGP